MHSLTAATVEQAVTAATVAIHKLTAVTAATAELPYRQKSKLNNDAWQLIHKMALLIIK
jgi:hypothetical protein